MKIHYRLNRVCLLFAMLIGLPSLGQAQFNYTTNADGVSLTITGYTGSGGAVTIPQTINGLAVTAIGGGAFQNNNSLTSVIIPNGVTSIGSYAFYNCNYLTNVTIPDSVTSLGYWSFTYCYSLTNVTLGNGITSIGIAVFGYCSSLQNIIIPAGVTSFGQVAFYGCSSMAGMYFKGAPPSLGPDVFDSDNATVYYIPGSGSWGTQLGNLNTAPWILFNYTTNNGAVTITGYTGFGGAVFIPDTINGLPVSAIADWAFLDASSVSSVTIPGSVTSIGYGVFADCFGLGSITISNGVASIGAFAFNNCSGLPSIAIPASVTNIDGTAFTWCLHLAAITVDPLNDNYSSTNGVLFDKNQDKLIFYPEGKAGGYTIPDGVTDIGAWAFFVCPLTGVTISDSVTNIEAYAFDSCFSLSSVTLGNNLTSIGDYAFDECQISTITIPASVSSLGNDVFGACLNLSSITVDPLNSFYSSTNGVLFDKNQTTLLQCPSDKQGDYSIPTNCVDIADYAFENCSLTNVIIPGSVTNIGYGTFFGNRALLSVIIPDGVTSIQDYAFFECISLASVTIPDSVTSIGNSSFYGCTALQDVTIGSSESESSDAKTIVSQDQSPIVAFSIGTDAFGDCPNLNAINVDSQNNAYSSLNGVLFDKNQTTLIQCPGGRTGTYSVPDNTTVIGGFAFDGCASLNIITIPDTVTNISDYAFTGCSGLTGIYFQGNPPGLGGSEIFSNAANATIYYLPGNTNWSPSFDGHPTAVWLPQFQTTDASFGVRTNQFGFNVFWASGQVVIVEACTNISNPVWQPMQTNTLTGSPLYFHDPQWTNYPGRFYRIRSP